MPLTDSDTSSAELNERKNAPRPLEFKENDTLRHFSGAHNTSAMSDEYQQMLNLDFFHDSICDNDPIDYETSKSAEFRRSLVDEVKRFGKIYVEPPTSKSLRRQIHLQKYNTRKMQKQRAKLAYKWGISDIPYEDSDPENDRCQTPESASSSPDESDSGKSVERSESTSNSEQKEIPRQMPKKELPPPNSQPSKREKNRTKAKSPVAEAPVRQRHQTQHQNVDPVRPQLTFSENLPVGNSGNLLLKQGHGDRQRSRLQSSTPASDLTLTPGPTPSKNFGPSTSERNFYDKSPVKNSVDRPNPSLYQNSPYRPEYHFKGNKHSYWAAEQHWKPHSQQHWNTQLQLERENPANFRRGGVGDWGNNKQCKPPPKEHYPVSEAYPSDHPMKDQLILLKRAIGKIAAKQITIPEELKQLQKELLNCHWANDYYSSPPSTLKKRRAILGSTPGAPSSVSPLCPRGMEDVGASDINFQYTPESIESTKFMVYLNVQPDLLNSDEESDYFLSHVKVS